ncbi:hypothetical protein HDE_07509 [Halotydeus destructor]|nr:hypothetical protein HDE_07509 [Halotydeus destructor]
MSVKKKRDESYVKGRDMSRTLHSKVKALRDELNDSRIAVTLYEKARIRQGKAFDCADGKPRVQEVRSFENKQVQTTINGFIEPKLEENDVKPNVKTDYIDPVLGIKSKRPLGQLTVEHQRFKQRGQTRVFKQENKELVQRQLGLNPSFNAPSTSSSPNYNFAPEVKPKIDIDAILKLAQQMNPANGPVDVKPVFHQMPQVMSNPDEPIELSDDDDIMPVDSDGNEITDKEEQILKDLGVSEETMKLMRE